MPTLSLTCSNTGILNSDEFSWCVSISDGDRAYNEAPGVIAILIIILSTETRPVPKCSVTCSKTGIIPSDDFQATGEQQ